MQGQPPPSTVAPSPLARAVEVFARDLLMLLRGTRMYPHGHPFLSAAVERLLAGVPWDPRGRFSLGVNRSELVVGNEFVGATGSRSAALAALLVKRRVGRLVFSRAAQAAEILELAGLLAGSRSTGADLQRELSARGVFAVAVEPLNLERIHDAAAPGGLGSGLPAGDRGRQAWLWLQSAEASPEELARILASDDLWQALGSEQGADVRTCALLLAGLGDRLDQALGFLSDEQRERVLARVAHIGASLTPSDLANLVATDDAGSLLRGAGSSALLSALDPERFVDLLANLAALGNRGSRRLAAVFRRFAPPGGTQSALALVRSRLEGGIGQKFALEVWQSVEEFLLKLEEDPFMAQDYSEILDAAEDERRLVADDRDDDLAENCERHLDVVVVGLAADGGYLWRQRLLDRLAERLEEAGPQGAVSYANLVDEGLPGLIDERAPLIRDIFRRSLAEAREARKGELQELVRFCRSHEVLLLGSALRMLEQEQRIASRRFLVEILAGFSPAATPAMVSRARAGPWFVTRNLVIVLGRQGGVRATPVLREFLDHRHPKVRREAQRVLGSSR